MLNNILNAIIYIFQKAYSFILVLFSGVPGRHMQLLFFQYIYNIFI